MLVDGHVHFYSMFHPHIGLDAAASSFRAVRSIRGLPSGGPDCLIVVDDSRSEGFARLVTRGADGWTIAAGDALSVHATRDRDGARLTVIAGRQIRTRNGLEILGYFTTASILDGPSLATLVEAVLASGGIPVVPWGFGKWWGRRGREVRELLASSLSSRIYLADSATRPHTMPAPRLFELASRMKVPVIAGTDPLPFGGEERKIGRYGFALEAAGTASDTADDLRAVLRSRMIEPVIFGRRERTAAALGLQLRMQARRSMARKTGTGEGPRSRQVP